MRFPEIEEASAAPDVIGRFVIHVVTIDLLSKDLPMLVEIRRSGIGCSTSTTSFPFILEGRRQW